MPLSEFSTIIKYCPDKVKKISIVNADVDWELNLDNGKKIILKGGLDDNDDYNFFDSKKYILPNLEEYTEITKEDNPVINISGSKKLKNVKTEYYNITKNIAKNLQNSNLYLFEINDYNVSTEMKKFKNFFPNSSVNYVQDEALKIIPLKPKKSSAKKPLK